MKNNENNKKLYCFSYKYILKTARNVSCFGGNLNQRQLRILPRCYKIK